MEKEFKKEISSLHEIFEFVHHFLEQNKIDESHAFTLDLVVEELFTNLVKYDPENKKEILIDINRQDNRVVVDLIDFDSKPFDLTQTNEVDVYIPLEDRRIGGLGIHLVKKMVDDLSYQYVNGTTKITFVKNLEK